MLARIYDYAEENDYIKKNFFRGFNKIEKTQSKIATKQVIPMTFEEERKFKSYLVEDTNTYKHLALIQLYTGMRLGEVLALNISDIDLKSNTIHVNKILTNDENHKPYVHESSLSQTKKGARLVQINDVFKNSVIEAISNAEINEDNKDKLLFCKSDGSLKIISATPPATSRNNIIVKLSTPWVNKLKNANMVTTTGIIVIHFFNLIPRLVISSFHYIVFYNTIASFSFICLPKDWIFLFNFAT